MNINYHIQPRKTGYFLGAIAIVLVILSLTGEYLFQIDFFNVSDDSPILFVLDVFSVNIEQSIPTWFSVIILFFASVLLTWIAVGKWRTNDQYRAHWVGLAVTFMYLSIDEGAVIHEILATELQVELELTNYLYFGWHVIAVPLVIIFGLIYLRFVFHLPARIRNLFIISAGIYVGGALGVEAISANRWYLDQGLSLTYLAIATLEEFCEMMGVIVFIYALLTYINQSDYSLTLVPNKEQQKEQQAESALIDSNLAPDGAVASNSHTPPILQRVNPLVLVIAVLIITNIAALVWITAGEPAVVTAEETSTQFYAPINDQLNEDNVIVVQMAEVFDFENPAGYQVAGSLLALYDEVFVVSLPEAGNSFIFAGDTLPFDRDSVTELLHANGDVQFIIFDTMMVQAIASATQSTTSE